jgi:hypothetical protein
MFGYKRDEDDVPNRGCYITRHLLVGAGVLSALLK